MEHELPLAQQVAIPNVSESLSPLSKEVDPANQNRFIPYFGVVSDFEVVDHRVEILAICMRRISSNMMFLVLAMALVVKLTRIITGGMNVCVCVCLITAACRSLHEPHLEPQSSCQCCCGSLCTRRRRSC